MVRDEWLTASDRGGQFQPIRNVLRLLTRLKIGASLEFRAIRTNAS